MNGVEIAVAAVVFMLVGFGLCALGIFCYFMLKMMRDLQGAADEVVRVMRETLGESRAIVTQAKELLGENSATSRAAKAVSALSNNLPEIMGGLKVFNETFSMIYRRTFDPEKVKAPPAAEEEVAGDSAFYGYSEQEAAQNEVTRNQRRERMVLSDVELAGMRTDNFRESRPAPEPPTPTS